MALRRRARSGEIPSLFAVSAGDSGLKLSFVGRDAIFLTFFKILPSCPYFTTGNTMRDAIFGVQYTLCVAGTKSLACAL